MKLDPNKDYGFSTPHMSDSKKLPPWDAFRLKSIGEIFETCDEILDFGDSSRALSELFEKELQGKKRTTVDINADYGPDVVADICDLNMFADASIDGIILAAVLEHVYNPFKAVEEVMRVLKPGGKLYVYVPWMYRYHAPEREFSDYYRFSKDGVRYLFKDFSKLELCPVRGHMETVLNFTSRFGKKSLFNRLFGGLVRKFDKCDEKRTSGFNIMLER